MGHCVVPKRTAVELYHNQSGNAATVTIFGQAISSTTNANITTVVGVAATTLGAQSTIAQAAVGTYKSVTALNFKCAYDYCNSEYPAPNYITGVANTFQGVYRTSTSCRSNSSDLKGYWTGHTGGAFISTDGNQTNPKEYPYSCQCSNCCTTQSYGGNEMQNPIIWAEANGSMVCNAHGVMWHSKVIGFMPAWASGCMCMRCCWPTMLSFITQAHIGHGVTAAQRAAQFMVNPMCCCAQNDTWAYKTGTNNTAPMTKWCSCDQNDGYCCQGGSHCNIQGCCTRINMPGCCCVQYMLWNWYALCNCPRSKATPVRNTVTNLSTGCVQTDFNCGAGGCAWSGRCPKTIPCGKYQSPMWWAIQWCGDNPHSCCSWGYIRQGNGYWICTCCTDVCGCICWSQNITRGLCGPGCSQNAEPIYQTIYDWTCKFQCASRACNSPDIGDKKMSPWGFMFGMTNCMVLMYNCNTAGPGGGRCQSYMFGINDIARHFGCMCEFGCNCYYAKSYRFYVPYEGMSSKGDEFSVKYFAYNPFDHYVYLAVRSCLSTACGIFRMDPYGVQHEMGPHCDCSNGSDQCCGLVTAQDLTRSFVIGDAAWTTEFDTNGGACVFCRVAEWPKAWDSSKYTVPGFCVSCLYRSEKCRWIQSIYNHVSSAWDTYSTTNLYQWVQVENSEDALPFSLASSDTLRTNITDDFACIISVCNCFFSNIDCSGLIDYQVEANQYERTGVTVKNGDRIMVNNNADVITSMQVWGYEG